MLTYYQGTAKQRRALGAYIKLLRAADSVRNRAMAHLAAENLTAGQFGTLEVLLHRGPLCQKEIAAKLLVSGGNITMVIDNLEKRGLVERRRNRNDRRYISVTLTASGRHLISRIFPRHVTRVVEEMSLLAPAEQDQLGILCRRVGKKIGKKEERS
jgi:MarR family 2-MHQ and catechol resistance regulon transcriptional repressor